MRAAYWMPSIGAALIGIVTIVLLPSPAISSGWICKEIEKNALTVKFVLKNQNLPELIAEFPRLYYGSGNKNDVEYVDKIISTSAFTLAVNYPSFCPALKIHNENKQYIERRNEYIKRITITLDVRSIRNIWKSLQHGYYINRKKTQYGIDRYLPKTENSEPDPRKTRYFYFDGDETDPPVYIHCRTWVEGSREECGLETAAGNNLTVHASIDASEIKDWRILANELRSFARSITRQTDSVED